MTVLALLPADHIRVLHPEERRGIATMAVRGHKWVEKAIPIIDLPAYAAAMRGKTDVFVSQQSFWGWRRIAQLAQLGAFYSDLDYRNTDWRRHSPETVAHAVLRTLDDVQIPIPSYILSTGRGLLVAWLHDLVPRGALPRWMAVQRRLLEVLRPFGADPKALDAARVFRLAGTRHSSAGTIVRPVWMVAETDRLWRWSFDDLAKEILPLARANLISPQIRRAERQAWEQKVSPIQRLNAGTYWETVLTDLQRLRMHRWFGPLPPGQRDTWLFLAANAMAWLAPIFVFRREIYALASEVGGWQQAECDARLSSVISRAERAAQGQRQEWKGYLIDPRYRFKSQTIIEWLDIQPTEMHEANLRVLVNRDVAREHAAERQAAARRRQGAQIRTDYEAAAVSRRQLIIQMRAQGMTFRAIAAELSISHSEVQRLAQRSV